MNTHELKLAGTSLMLLIALVGHAAAQERANYYITVDGRDPLTFGAYSGLSNPNVGRLTMLYAHWNDETPLNNHFHGIGTYAYEGPVDSPTVTPTNTNNRIPETYTGQEPLTLQPGTGALAGRWVSLASDEHYSDIELHSIHELGAAENGSPESIMYHSSGGGYASTTMDGLNLAIELVSMTPGLYLGTEQLSEPGQQLVIGGEDSLPFLPVFWTEGDAPAGQYSAAFQLVDLSGTYASSGTMYFDFAVVPEPTGVCLGGLACLGLAVRRRRR